MDGIANWRKIPFLRWSVWRLVFGIGRLEREGQVGDGRESRLADHVTARARRGDAADVIRVIDDFAYNRSMLINVGDVKGRILDDAVVRAGPQRILELGAYCGYSALRMSVAAPTARIVSVEFSPANAAIARRVLDHAGVSDRVAIVAGTLGDGGKTIDVLKTEHDLAPGSVDLVFIDHAKEAYLSDLELILREGWIHPGSVVVADNVKVPGAPDYLAYMRGNEGRSWRTVEHQTHVEYQSLIRDLVLVSERLVNRP
jgi:catechol O-methyltransferase